MNGSGRSGRDGSRGSDGRFSGARLHVEAVPRLPTFPARWTLEDPRGRPYFVFWTDRGGELSHHVRMATLGEDAVLVSRPDDKRCRIRLLRMPLPRRGGTALLYRCPRCGMPRRYLYGLALIAGRCVEDGVWRCHHCAGLLFRSQGCYRSRLERAMFTVCYGDLRVREPLPRHPWDPRAVSYPGMVVEEFGGALVER
jgi:hypothetical protein